MNCAVPNCCRFDEQNVICLLFSRYDLSIKNKLHAYLWMLCPWAFPGNIFFENYSSFSKTKADS